MKSFAELKRRLTVDTVLEVIFHVDPDWGQRMIGERLRITRVQTNGIYVQRPDDTKRSWQSWPKASGLRFDGPNDFFVYKEPDGSPTIGYRVISEGTNP
jgi:hypothetical protein